MSRTLKKERLSKTKVFANKKLRWRQRARRHLEKCDVYAHDVRKGKEVGYSVIMEAAYRIVELGEEGIELVGELNKLMPPKMVLTRNHIAALCNTLESMSTVLEYLIDQQDLPKVQFPLYRSELRTTMRIDLEPLEATDYILKQMAQHAAEKEESKT
jgi:hypothetical protein